MICPSFINIPILKGVTFLLDWIGSASALVAGSELRMLALVYLNLIVAHLLLEALERW